MKPVRLLLAAIVLAVLGGLIWWTNKHPSVDTSKKDPLTQKIVPLSLQASTSLAWRSTRPAAIQLRWR